MLRVLAEWRPDYPCFEDPHGHALSRWLRRLLHCAINKLADSRHA